MLQVEFIPNILQVIAAKGEQKASGALRAAAETMEQAPAALQLRFLQVSPGPWQDTVHYFLIGDGVKVEKKVR